MHAPCQQSRKALRHTGGRPNHQDDSYLSLEGHQFVQIAHDGIALGTLDQARLPLSSPDREQPGAMLIAPGRRIDVLVKAGEPGTQELRALPYNQGCESPQGLIARVVVSGEPLPMDLPAALPPGPFDTIRGEEITGSRRLTFSAIRPEVDAAGHWQEFSFLIDGKVFDANRVDQRWRLALSRNGRSTMSIRTTTSSTST